MAFVRTYRDSTTEELLVSLANALAAQEAVASKGFVVLADTLGIAVNGIERELHVRGMKGLLNRVKGQVSVPYKGVACGAH
jgi:hypothetical protein